MIPPAQEKKKRQGVLVEIKGIQTLVAKTARYCKVLLAMVDMSLSNCPTNKNLLWLKPGCLFIKKPYRYISIYIACVRRFYGQPSEGTSKKEAEGGVVKL